MANGTITITIKYGFGNSIIKEVPVGTTVGDIIGDGGFQSALGYGNDVVARVTNQTVENGTVLNNGALLSLEKRANAKADAA